MRKSALKALGVERQLWFFHFCQSYAGLRPLFQRLETLKTRKVNKNLCFFQSDLVLRFFNSRKSIFEIIDFPLNLPSQVCEIAVGLAKPLISPRRELNFGPKSGFWTLYTTLGPLCRRPVFDPLGSPWEAESCLKSRLAPLGSLWPG